METKSQKFTLKKFLKLDESNNSDYLINSLEAHYQSASMKKIKKNALELIDYKPHSLLIELGCGLGYDAAAMADLAGETSKVIAVDASNRVLEEAMKRAPHPQLTYMKGEANHTGFDNGHFDVCRMDRLLVSQKEYTRTFEEVVRILKKNGQLCVTALDFGTISLYPNIIPITPILINYWQTLVENPFVGRSLLSLFRKHQFTNLKIQPEVFYIDSYQTLQKIVPIELMLEDMITFEYIKPQHKTEILEHFIRAEMKQEFYWSINLVTICGTKM